MNIIDIEKALTALIADILDMTIDAGIYRGGIPLGVAFPAVGVLLGGELKTSKIALKEYNVQVLGKFTERDAALKMLSKLNCDLPIYGKTVNNIKIVTLLPRGSGTPYMMSDSGKLVHYASYNAVVSMLTTGTQV